jgi:diaminopimelate decarboxylase
MRPAALADPLLAALAREHGTPLYVYHLPTVRERVARLAGEFDVVRYAQKANSHPDVLRAVRAAGALVDASSAAEVRRALECGFAPEDVVLTSDLFDRDMLALLAEVPCGVNAGSPFMLDQLARVRRDARVTLRVNPGFGHGHDRRVTTGGERSKHGIWHAELPDVLRHARAIGVRVTGLHVHVGSGADLDNLVRAREVLRPAAELVGEGLATLSAGGGLPIPYRAGEHELDVASYAAAWRALRDELPTRPRLEVEPGRYLVAECGVLVCEVRGTKRQGANEFVMVDAGFHNLIRPAMYGAYHRVTALGKDGEATAPRSVAGPLCESADVFTQGKDGELAPQELPALAEGDLLCIHDAGAYGASMQSDYNLQRRAVEVVLER